MAVFDLKCYNGTYFLMKILIQAKKPFVKKNPLNNILYIYMCMCTYTPLILCSKILVYLCLWGKFYYLKSKRKREKQYLNVSKHFYSYFK